MPHTIPTLGELWGALRRRLTRPTPRLRISEAALQEALRGLYTQTEGSVSIGTPVMTGAPVISPLFAYVPPGTARGASAAPPPAPPRMSVFTDALAAIERAPSLVTAAVEAVQKIEQFLEEIAPVLSAIDSVRGITALPAGAPAAPAVGTPAPQVTA